MIVAKEKICKGKTTKGNRKKVAPLLVIWVFDIESDMNKCFDVGNGVGKI